MIRATLEELRLSEEEMGPLWRLLPGPEPGLTLPAQGDEDGAGDMAGAGAVGGSGDGAGAGSPGGEMAAGGSGHGAGRRLLRVCDTLLDGNELRYVTECIESNWISSAGRFVGAFEERFAAAAGCAHGVACARGPAPPPPAPAGARRSPPRAPGGPGGRGASSPPATGSPCSRTRRKRTAPPIAARR